jgi:hypothetical protein
VTEYKRGVLAAANVAATYNGSTTHPYRLDDCITSKLNLTKRGKPRRNHQKIEDPDSAWMRGVATALAEMYRSLVDGNDSRNARRVATACGLTLAHARRCAVAAYDLRALRRAGVQ